MELVIKLLVIEYDMGNKTIKKVKPNHFKTHPNFVVSPDLLVEEFDITYNTAMGTLYRLYKEGAVEKVGKGQYSYYEDKGEVGPIVDDKIEKINQADIDANLQKNIEIFNKKSENNVLRKFSLRYIETLSQRFRIDTNEKVIDLINNVKNVGDIYQPIIINILKNILRFEDIKNDNEKSRKNVIKKCYTTIKELILTENANISARIVAWETFIDLMARDEDLVGIYFQIVRGEEHSWEKLGTPSLFVSRIRKYPVKVKEDFINNLNNLVRESDERLVERAEQIHFQVLNHYPDFILRNNENPPSIEDDDIW